MRNAINEQQGKKRREKWIKSQITIYKTGKLMWLRKNLFLIKGLSIIEDFTVGNESFSTVSHGYLKMENLNFSICCNHHCYFITLDSVETLNVCFQQEKLRWWLWILWYFIFSLDIYVFRLPLTCFAVFHIKQNGNQCSS